MPRLKPFARVLGWNVAIGLAMVATLELVFGSWFSDDPLRRLQVPRNVSWRYEIDYAGIRDAARHVVYSRDRYGLRGDFGAPRDIDVLTVGGSTTDQRFISDGKTWQAVLQRRFRESGNDIRIANAGLNGRTTFGHLHDFELWFPRIPGLSPGFVLLYVGINDMFVDRPHALWDRPYRGDRSVARMIEDRSALYDVYRKIAGAIEARRWNLNRLSAAAEGASWTDQPLLAHHRERLASRVEGFRFRLDEILERVEAMGATPIVVTQPRGDYRFVDGRLTGLQNTQPRARRSIRDGALGLLRPGTANGVDYYRMLAPFNETSLTLCRQHGGICIDLANELGFDDGDFYDPVHNTVGGSRKIGNFLFARLRGVMAIQQRPDRDRGRRSRQ